MYDTRFKLQAQLLKALAQSRRLEIIQLLRDQELPVSDIHEMLDLPQANVSQHLTILKDAHILKSRKNGKHVYYSLADKQILQAVDLIRQSLIATIEKPQLKSDLNQPLKELLPLVHDPVCRMRVSPQSTDFFYSYQGHTYYFCASGCLKKFKFYPQKYAQ